MEITIKYLQKEFLVEDTKQKDHLHSKGFGEKVGDMYILSIYEVLYLLEKKKCGVVQGKKELSYNQLIAKKTTDVVGYRVYRNLKKKGYHVKSGLKYGFTFRVYDKGIKQGEDHALWLVHPLHESEKFKVRDFAGKNRVAHSTKKKLLVAIVDDSDVTYLEINWKRL